MMTLEVKLTKIPQFNSIVIQQRGGRLFISAPNVIIIDREGLLKLVEELIKVDFISAREVSWLTVRIGIENENKENGSSSSSG